MGNECRISCKTTHGFDPNFTRYDGIEMDEEVKDLALSSLVLMSDVTNRHSETSLLPFGNLGRKRMRLR